MALMGLLMPPSLAAALMVLPSLATNVAQCAGPHWRMLARRLWPLWLGLAATVVFSPLPDLGSADLHARAMLGGVLVAYALWGMAGLSLPAPGRHAASVGGIAGILSGVLTAATGVFVMPLVPYLQSLRLAREELIQALGLSFTVATLALAIRLRHTGAAGWPVDGVASLVALAGAFAGLWVGARLRSRLQPATFKRVLYGVFLLLGVLMVSHSL
jgi:uncharacterized membrane protein YfcA